MLRVLTILVPAVLILAFPELVDAAGCDAPSFAAAANFPAGTAPVAVAAGDFNGDGRLDLALANTRSDSVAILLGSDTGGFAAATDFRVGTNLAEIVTGDFDGDGHLDLGVVGFTSETIAVLLGSGTGGFGAATRAFTAHGSSAVWEPIGVRETTLQSLTSRAPACRFSGSRPDHFQRWSVARP